MRTNMFVPHRLRLLVCNFWLDTLLVCDGFSEVTVHHFVFPKIVYYKKTM